MAQPTVPNRAGLAALLFGCATLALEPALGSQPQPAAEVRQLMVKFRDVSAARSLALPRQALGALSATAGASLTHSRRMSGEMQVLRLPRAMSVAEANVVAQQLSQDPSVEGVELDRWVQPLLVPNDPSYPQQWHLHEAASEIAGANLPAAWDLSTGAGGLTIAVVDTGLIAHSDIDGDGRRAPGYDFISDRFIANDGDGRDADPTDPGDWVAPEDVGGHPLCAAAEPSSWHGSHVAGIIGAASQNGLGVAGVNWNSQLLPVRVLGKCGGYLSDVLDGTRWAAGLAVPGVPANPHPARVINLSLGANTACSSFIQAIMNEVLATGAVVVAAGGNSAGDAGAVAPGNCAGVIAVGAVDRLGNRAYYSSTGSTISLSAPGGGQFFVNDSRGILSVLNTGSTAPDASPTGDRYAFLQGTSMAAPHVAGVASLMLSLNPALTPDQVRRKLRATARAFPAGSSCTPSLCGSGMLDAHAALQSAANVAPPLAHAGDDTEAEPGAVVTLNASGSAAIGPKTIARFTWTQLSGVPVALRDAQGPTPSFTAPGGPDVLRFQLTVTDDGGLSGSDGVQVELSGAFATAAASDASNGGGGGGGGCFIATAAYGTASATEVRSLRVFRDRHLLTNPAGRAFVATYYTLSPVFADAIRPYPQLRALVRAGLVPYVTVARWFDFAGADSEPAVKP